MNDGSRGCLHRNPETRQVNGSHSMQVPAIASSAAIQPLWQSDFRNMHPSQPTSFQEDIQPSSAVENGDSSFNHSQSTDNSRLRSSHSPSVLGSGSQTSLTTVEGISEPSAVGHAVNKPHKPFDVSVRTATGSSIPQNGSVTLEGDMEGRSATSGPQSASKFSVGDNGTSSMASTAHTDAASLSHLQYRSNMTPKPPQPISGHKRTATGDIKAISDAVEPRDSDLNTAWRRRSKSIGTASHGSRIAELSVHLRTRLSYAAAKVEKDWQRDGQVQIPFRMRQSASPTSTSSGTKHHTTEILSSQDNSSTTSHFYRPNDSVQKHHSLIPDILPSERTSHKTLTATSPTKPFPMPKLAPPVDIISSGGSGRRRRPNPNETSANSRYSPYSGHRRYHSQQEFGASKLTAKQHPVLVPGTPPLRPSTHTASTPFPSQNGHYRSRTHSQSTLMEQDAIETLLFMSSPENSGYRASPQPRPDSIPKSIAPSVSGNSNLFGSQNKQSHMSPANEPSSKLSNEVLGLEANAGDEIDRMLDQMEDSDSDDERGFSSNHHSQMSVVSHSENSCQGHYVPSGPWRARGI
ncbi:hypothetical protein PHISCL_05205 [Aspergillus sclerotialis]|uniref:Uncharacterized protein n=1 Tax=Aspergillus sclerotialis TaxID=2070753 RepID=A0A3A2ZJK0_9EURO|nr:hypothetical protein PHISCL_05205 [Aspergillus sclerotialis]